MSICRGCGKEIKGDQMKVLGNNEYHYSHAPKGRGTTYHRAGKGWNIGPKPRKKGKA